MTEKQTYWLVDLNGVKALATGVEERARWNPRGWSEADEPGPDERIWARCEGVELPAMFPYRAWQELWQHKGWQPSTPAEPIDPITGVRPPAPVPAELPDEPVEAKSKANSAAGVKERDRG
jgi:hypothetical protein